MDADADKARGEMLDLQHAFIASGRNLLKLPLHCSRPATSPPSPALRTAGSDPITCIPRGRRRLHHLPATPSPVSHVAGGTPIPYSSRSWWRCDLAGEDAATQYWPGGPGLPEGMADSS